MTAVEWDMLTVSDLTLRRGPRALFTELSFSVFAGQRVGVIGANGVGKSSLFAAIQGELGVDAGDIAVQRGVTVTAVAQDVPPLPETALQSALDGDVELRATERALARAEAANDAAGIARCHDTLAAIDGYAAEARCAQMLRGLGFTPEMQVRPVSSFSGGWRMRLNLARALMRRADLLLLDEPTNHLDLDASLWLQDLLASFAGGLLLISHDRAFLDAVTTHSLHLTPEGGMLYTGGVTQFERTRSERLAQQAATHANQQARAAELQRFVDRFRAQATKARQAQSRLKALARMEMIAPVLAESPFSFRFRAPEKLPHPLLSVMRGQVGYGDTVLLRQLKLVLNPGDRIALLGANGAGKSTLIKSLAGTQPWLEGQVTRAPDLAVGYYAQHQMEQLDPAASPLLHLQRLDPSATEQALRDYLGQFAFHGDRQLEAIAPFSGGEKARLALAQVIYQRPALLLLDEPTNHLDLQMREALAMALQDFPGAVVLISHDRHLVESTCDALWRVADGRCEPYDGDLDDYARWLRAQRDGSGGGGGKATAGRTQVDTRALRDQVKKLDRQMARLSAELAVLDDRLADPALYAASRRAEAEKLQHEQGQLKARLADVEAAWLDASEALEAS
ncbi:MAG: ATP-binding cassette domain-containing protein [Polycyclovorans sp.]|nr:ATP-binding cassette domain-containing protein [Polycyclovorans sp.]|tara:strand:+ start:14312 stop:16180 length:1869 start_codon:yes stop_codon:yes gene_type:complete